MTKFILKTVIFVFVFVVILLLLLKLSEAMIAWRAAEMFGLGRRVHIVFAGDSNVECAINDSLIPGSVNIASSSEAYLYTYVKLRAILKNNPQISTVFLGYSVHSLGRSVDRKYLYDSGNLAYRLPFLSHLMEREEKSLLWRNNPKTCFLAIFAIIKQNFSTAIVDARVFGRNLPYGGYLYLKRDKLDEGKRLFAVDPNPLKKSDAQVRYLMKIAQICREYSVKLILLDTPKHPFYCARITGIAKAQWIDVAHGLSPAEIMDCSQYELPDTCYGDLTHLNDQGAALFSISEVLTRRVMMAAKPLSEVKSMDIGDKVVKP